MLLLNYKTRIWSERTPHTHLTQKQKGGGQLVWSVPSPPGTIPQLIVLPDKQRPRNSWHFHHLHFKKKKRSGTSEGRKKKHMLSHPTCLERLPALLYTCKRLQPCTQPRAGLTGVIWLRLLCSLCYIKKKRRLGDINGKCGTVSAAKPRLCPPSFLCLARGAEGLGIKVLLKSWDRDKAGER